jgi:hypothetical protein
MFKTLILANWIIVNVLDKAQPAEHSALTLRLIDPIVFEIWQNVENLILANWRNNSVVDAPQPAEHNALTLRSIGQIVFEIWQNVSNTYSLKLNNCQCSRRSATCWAQRVDTQVDWPNSFWDMTKCLKPYSCKLKKQQCSRRSATCWAQRVDTNVGLANSFWDMTKCLKHLFLQIEWLSV